MKATLLLLLLALLLVPRWFFGQGITNNGGRIVSSSGSYWKVSGGFFNFKSQAKDKTTFNNLAIASGAGISIDPHSFVTINGTLNNNGGTSGLILKSDVSGTASLLHNTANVDATVERFVSGSTDILDKHYHLVSVPVNSPSYLSEVWLDSYLFTYLENSNTWKAWSDPVNTILQTKQGAMIFYPFGNSKIYSITGKLNNGAYTPTIAYSGTNNGYNLVPNPYPSAINWNASGGWTKNNMSETIWGFSPAARNYGAWNGSVSTNSVSNIIPEGQAFFVRAIGSSPVLTMDNAVRLHDFSVFLKSSNLVPDVLHLLAVGAKGQDEIAIQFADDATFFHNDIFDAKKFYGSMSVPQLSTYTNEDESLLSISCIPANGTTVIPLRFEMNYSGQITFRASGMQSFQNVTSIQLEDKQLAQLTDLGTNPIYQFNYTPADNTDRFALHFLNATSVADPKKAKDFNVYAANGILNIYNINRSSIRS